jgi:hypothetical protein
LIDVDPNNVGSGGCPLVINTAGSMKVTLSSSGNLGLGVTPSATNGTYFRAYEVGKAGCTLTGATVSLTGNSRLYLSNNAYGTYSGSVAWVYGNNDAAVQYAQESGAHKWFTAPSGTAGNTISFTQAMTLSVTGANSNNTTLNLKGGAGGGSDVAKIDFERDGTAVLGTIQLQRDGGNGAGALQFFTNNGSSNSERARITSDGDVGFGMSKKIGAGLGYLGNTTASGAGYLELYNSSTGNTSLFNTSAFPLLFGTNNTERARITSGGYFKASNDGTYIDTTSSQFEFRGSTSTALIAFENRTNSSPNGMYLDFSGASPDNNTNYFLYAEDSTTVRCIIYSDGDLANHDGVYGTISDERLKQDIVDAPSQWDDLKAVRFRKYRMKTDVEANPDAPALLGVVAQELEQTSPGLIDEHPNEDGTTTKTVKSSILLMKAAVALQEAMARIEKLEAEMAALKGA